MLSEELSAYGALASRVTASSRINVENYYVTSSFLTVIDFHDIACVRDK